MKMIPNPRRLALLSLSALGAYTAWTVNGIEPPREDSSYDYDLESRLETFATEDGAVLKLKRYVREGAQPVLLVHGFLGNGLEFDLPHPRHNLAAYLAREGYDVWISSFRGCGRHPYRSETPHWHHSVDHLAALDAPALVEGIRAATGRRPIWIGHSMGGIVLYLYLQGVRMEKNNASARATTDPDLARERNRSILAGVTIGSPPGLYRHGGDWVARALELPFHRPFLQAIIGCLRLMNRRLPLLPVSRVGRIAELYPRLGKLMAMKSPVAFALYNVDNVDPDVGYSLFKRAADNVTADMTIQILSLGLDPDLKDIRGEVNYTADMERITAPLLFITGTRDFAGPEDIREYGHERVSSRIKDYRCYPEYGHTDLVMGKRVADEVYPYIASWLADILVKVGEGGEGETAARASSHGQKR
jgi:pimeloyl-ACP methyl ester carboxylesterase